MDRVQLKQRIVGAIVLVALGVIFIPMILNREDNVSGISGTNIPEKPPELAQLAKQSPPALPSPPPQPAETRQLVDENTPKLPEATEPAKLSEPVKPTETTAPAVKPAPPVAPDTKKPEPAQQDTARGWVVQVASLTERTKALQLRNRLRQAKYTCYVESVTSKQGTLYRVRVGPVIKREEAEALQAQIAKQLKLKDTLVMAHP